MVVIKVSALDPICNAEHQKFMDFDTKVEDI